MFISKISHFLLQNYDNMLGILVSEGSYCRDALLNSLFEIQWIETFKNNPLYYIKQVSKSINSCDEDKLYVIFVNFFNNILLDTNNFKVIVDSNNNEIIPEIMVILDQMKNNVYNRVLDELCALNL